jgi:hypothetical protein
MALIANVFDLVDLIASAIAAHIASLTSQNKQSGCALNLPDDRTGALVQTGSESGAGYGSMSVSMRDPLHYFARLVGPPLDRRGPTTAACPLRRCRHREDDSR